MLLVFDVGGTFIKYAWMTREGEILEKNKIKTIIEPDTTPEDFVEEIYKIYCVYKQKETPEGIAISLPGQIDVENGIVYGGGALKYLDEVHLGQMISDKCDGIKVALENDGKCAALAEIWKGNAKDVNDACVIIIGTGIGGGIIVDRKVHHGSRLIAGELSFLLENIKRSEVDDIYPIEDTKSVTEIFDSFPYIASSTCTAANLTHRYALAKGVSDKEVSGELIYERAGEGEELAIEMLEDTYFHIAKMCINLYVVLNPEIILIGGGISAAPGFIDGVIRYVEKLKTITKIYEGVKVQGCKYLNDSNLLGAVFNYIQNE